jgi:hypothetical protein
MLRKVFISMVVVSLITIGVSTVVLGDSISSSEDISDINMTDSLDGVYQDVKDSNISERLVSWSIDKFEEELNKNSFLMLCLVVRITII